MLRANVTLCSSTSYSTITELQLFMADNSKKAFAFQTTRSFQHRSTTNKQYASETVISPRESCCHSLVHLIGLSSFDIFHCFKNKHIRLIPVGFQWTYRDWLINKPKTLDIQKPEALVTLTNPRSTLQWHMYCRLPGSHRTEHVGNHCPIPATTFGSCSVTAEPQPGLEHCRLSLSPLSNVPSTDILQPTQNEPVRFWVMRP